MTPKARYQAIEAAIHALRIDEDDPNCREALRHALQALLDDMYERDMKEVDAFLAIPENAEALRHIEH